MNFWITTDTHLGHRKMEEYCNRPSDFEFRIQKGFKVLTESDVLIHLGDVCIGEDAKWHEMMIRYLPCKKWLVRGNHDKKTNSWYLEHGWDFVGEEIRMKYYNRIIIAFSHYPIKYNNDFDINIHGHFHNHLHRLLEHRWVVEGEEERNRDTLSILTDKHKLIALENTNYQLTNLETFI